MGVIINNKRELERRAGGVIEILVNHSLIESPLNVHLHYNAVSLVGEVLMEEVETKDFRRNKLSWK